MDQEAEGHFTKPLNRFARTGAEGTWKKVRGTHVAVLEYDLNSDDGRALLRELRFIRPAGSLHDRKDLGEDMAMAHAAVLAIAGHDVEILIDEERAIERFRTYISERLESKYVGVSERITFLQTRTVVDTAERHWMKKATSAKTLYAALARFDDGLV